MKTIIFYSVHNSDAIPKNTNKKIVFFAMNIKSEIEILYTHSRPVYAL